MYLLHVYKPSIASLLYIYIYICSDVLTPIRGLQISGILDTSAHLSWEHDDPCVAVDHYEILVTPTGSPNSKSMPPYSSDILSFTLTNLISETSYKTEISVVTKDGNKSQAMIINFRTSGKFRHLRHHHHHSSPPPPLHHHHCHHHRHCHRHHYY